MMETIPANIPEVPIAELPLNTPKRVEAVLEARKFPDKLDTLLFPVCNAGVPDKAPQRKTFHVKDVMEQGARELTGLDAVKLFAVMDKAIASGKYPVDRAVRELVAFQFLGVSTQDMMNDDPTNVTLTVITAAGKKFVEAARKSVAAKKTPPKGLRFDGREAWEALELVQFMRASIKKKFDPSVIDVYATIPRDINLAPYGMERTITIEDDKPSDALLSLIGLNNATDRFAELTTRPHGKLFSDGELAVLEPYLFSASETPIPKQVHDKLIMKLRAAHQIGRIAVLTNNGSQRALTPAADQFFGMIVGGPGREPRSRLQLERALAHYPADQIKFDPDMTEESVVAMVGSLTLAIATIHTSTVV